MSHLFPIVNYDCKIVTSKGKRHTGKCKDDNNSKYMVKPVLMAIILQKAEAQRRK